MPAKIYITAFAQMWLVSHESRLCAMSRLMAMRLGEQQMTMAGNDVSLDGYKLPVLQNTAPLNLHVMERECQGGQKEEECLNMDRDKATA